MFLLFLHFSSTCQLLACQGELREHFDDKFRHFSLRSLARTQAIRNPAYPSSLNLCANFLASRNL